MTYKLYLGDCLEYMKTMPDKSMDAVITDPPYGIGENNIIPGSTLPCERWQGAYKKDYGDIDWDYKRIDQIHIDEIFRLGINQVIFGGNYYTDYLYPSSGWIVWDKFTSFRFSDCELIWTSYKQAARMFRYLWSGFKKEKPEVRYHPTQKPLALMVWIIENYTQISDTIFDPFMGSGTTGVACMQLGRNFIGCEIDPKYYAIAEKRIKQAAAQPLLFQEKKQEEKQIEMEVMP